MSKIPGVNSGITEFGAEFLGGVGLSQIAPKYVVDIAGVLTGRAGIKTTNAAKRLLLTSDREIVPLLKYGTKTQIDSAIGSAKKINENLYETTTETGETIKFAASFGDETMQRVGAATVLEEVDGSVVDDVVGVSLSRRQKKAYESGVGYYDDDLLMMETFGSGTRFVRNRGVSKKITVTSSIGHNPRLIRIAEEAGRNQQVQRDLDHLFSQMLLIFLKILREILNLKEFYKN